MTWVRRALHMALAALGAPVWVLFCACLAVMVLLAALGHRLWPAADRGNCWSFALPRWLAGGGALAIVPSGLWIGPIPILHAAWVPAGPQDYLQQTEPVSRVGKDAPLWRKATAFWYFKFSVESDDHRHQRWRWRERRDASRNRAADKEH